MDARLLYIKCLFNVLHIHVKSLLEVSFFASSLHCVLLRNHQRAKTQVGNLKDGSDVHLVFANPNHSKCWAALEESVVPKMKTTLQKLGFANVLNFVGVLR